MQNGQTITASPPESFRKKWERLPADEYLYRYLLANTPLTACNDGLPDEEQKVLKYFGVKYWEPGTEEVEFQGKKYKSVIPYEL